LLFPVLEYAFEKKLFFAGPELIQAYEEKHGGTAEVCCDNRLRQILVYTLPADYKIFLKAVWEEKIFWYRTVQYPSIKTSYRFCVCHDYY
jgi:hypothetical protein